MEDYLRDSPFEESTQNDPSKFKGYESYMNPSSGQEGNSQDDFSRSQPQTSESQPHNQDQFSLDLNQQFGDDYSSPAVTSPTNFQSPSYGGGAPQGQQQNLAPNDPYFSTFEFLSSPTQQPVSPRYQPQGAGNNNTNNEFSAGFGQQVSDPLQFNMNDNFTNLDQLVSPENNMNNSGMNIFSSAQYFSPNTRTNHYNHLSAIAEDSLPNSYQNTFSPELSRHGSVSIPPSGDPYVSPQANAFLSPQSRPHDNFDSLRSPYGGASYPNSPPPPLNLNMSKSIPTAVNFNQTSFNDSQRQQRQSIEDALSPPSSSYLGTSAPSNSKKPEPYPSSSKQLTQEEKAKRRREFHNAVERRRRDLIKEKIKELGFLVPPSLLNPHVCAVQNLSKQPHQNPPDIKELLQTVKVRETKPNKATILSTSVDYIEHLQKVADRQKQRREELEQEIAELEGGVGNVKLTETDNANLNNSSDLQEQLQSPNQDTQFNPDDFFSEVISDTNQF
ncbi:hypothetical protein FT663_01048 [Candidozyma haemuli var. vulneris]|uniref:BHLH domain-containing protein n=1 Tax=Candidozyma haemuli TaxID=45357 RepID=A0A2V1ATX3_9ASCO|nr:hypothetical protein CXQ85_000251 [[Candida] haemuloni]KAF3990270.1 hypothetical protein FT662_02364 [[Candida] haemuloni var. vulneris]KAF3994818.1 hypothetical protein FT663_01048 [[Candida] haemuloni var. vulneris]PVH21279.1 hypothetical protein CXQ85_000251 [[Candida] haemuloni]